MSDTQRAAEKVLKKLSEQLKCSVCFETYQLGDPKALPCLHVFCKTCLERVVSRDGTNLKCPLCRKTFQPPQGGVSQLPTAFYINHLFDLRDTLEKVKFAQIKCQKCTEQSDACGYCRNCNAFVCESCITIHKKLKDFLSHELTSLEEVQAEAINLIPTTKSVLTCLKHTSEVLKVYCETCEELVCHMCTVKTHRDHECVPVTECFCKHRDTIVANIQPVKQQLDTVNQAVGEMNARARRLTEQTLATKQNIQDEIDRLHDALEARKGELMAKVDQIAQTAEETYQAQLGSYKHTKTQLMNCLEYVEESLRTGSQEEILSVKKQIVQTVEEMTREFDSQSFQPEPEHILQFSHQNLMITEACQKFGEVFDLCTPVCSEKCNATGAGLQGSHRDVPVTLTLHTVDTREQPCTDPRAPVSGELVSRGDGGVVKCEVTRKKDNMYELEYQPRTTGEHDLHIKVYGRQIKNSPFTVTVSGFQGIHVKTIEGVSSPWQLVVTSSGEVIVTEYGSNCISVLDKDGNKLRSFGSTGATDSKLSNPRGVAICNNNSILVAATHCIKRFTLDGRFITSVGSQTDSGWINTIYTAAFGSQDKDKIHFDHPIAVAVSSMSRKVYVCDENNHRIQVLNNDLTYSSVFGSKGSGPGQFQYPSGIAINSSGQLHVADRWNNRIQIFSSSGQYLREIKERGPGMGVLSSPVSVCIDSQSFIYVLEYGCDCVSVFNSTGSFVRDFGRYGRNVGQFRSPLAIAVDVAGMVYVSDTFNDRIQIFR